MYLKMGLFTNYLKWDLFVIYMLICVIFLGSCCVWVSCMFLFYPAKNQNEPKKIKEWTNLSEDNKPKGARRNSTSSLHKDAASKIYIDQKSLRSKSINVDSFPASFRRNSSSSNNMKNAFSFRAVVEPLPSRQSEEIVPEANSVVNEKD